LKGIIESRLQLGFACETRVLPQSDCRLLINLTRST
jgi:hypothetical protein